MLELTRSSDRRTLTALRTHLIATSATVTGIFACTSLAFVLVPLGAQLNRAEVDSAQIIGLADHFLFIHSALWPLILLSMISCIVCATVLYLRLRSPLVRYVKAYDAIGRGEVPKPIVIRLGDYLSEETDALNRMLAALEARSRAHESNIDQFSDALDELARKGGDDHLIEELRSIMSADSKGVVQSEGRRLDVTPTTP